MADSYEVALSDAAKEDIEESGDPEQLLGLGDSRAESELTTRLRLLRIRGLVRIREDVFHSLNQNVPSFSIVNENGHFLRSSQRGSS